MSDIRYNAAKTVAEQIQLAEQSIDRALSDIYTLMARMADARVMAKLPVRAGIEVLSEVHAASANAYEMRNRIVAAHRRFAVLKGRIGLGEVSFGETGDTPAYGEMSDDAVVAAARIEKIVPIAA
ncbi:hypothetical protein FHR23_002897 [Stakelama sediminis]|uniref:Uncharacterized protein n=1 Tax=Stakelama sediminis TaxID=463200 RepID=A0A840Z1R7_9SPHN|nr:hypothetical protein [Stakelama sediminis]MBB5719938.1 hypothetical protein [Stakelama sediminis]